MVEEPIYDMEMTLESIITMDKARWSNNDTEKAEVRRNSSILIRSTSSRGMFLIHKNAPIKPLS